MAVTESSMAAQPMATTTIMTPLWTFSLWVVLRSFLEVGASSGLGSLSRLMRGLLFNMCNPFRLCCSRSGATRAPCSGAWFYVQNSQYFRTGSLELPWQLAITTERIRNGGGANGLPFTPPPQGKG